MGIALSVILAQLDKKGRHAAGKASVIGDERNPAARVYCEELGCANELQRMPPLLSPAIDRRPIDAPSPNGVSF